MIARGAMPEARWRRDWRAGIATVAQYERLRIARERGDAVGRAPLAALRCEADPGSAALADAPLGWVFAEVGQEPASLRMPPGASVRYRVRAEPGTRFEARLRAEGTDAAEGPGLEFVAVVREPGGTEQGRWSRHLGGPGEGTIGSVSLALPETPEGRLVLELAIAGGPEEGSERAVWIDPCLTSPRSARDSDPVERFPGSTPPRATPPGAERRDAGGGAGEVPTPATTPRFSILTPVHDPNPLFLDRAIASVLRQSVADWELCIYDDGSAEPEVHALLDEHARDPRVRIARGERATGIAQATNGALALASGEFVCLLDHDDEIEPDALAAIALALAEFPGADLIYTDEAIVDDGNRPLGTLLKPGWSPEFFESNMYSCHFGALRRTLVEEVGGFRSECDGSQDYDLMLRLGERGAMVVHTPGVRYYWRRHPESASAGAKPYAYAAAERALREHFERVGRPGAVESMRLLGSYRRSPIESEDRIAIVLAVPADRREPDAVEASVRALNGAREGAGVELVVAAGGPAAAELRPRLAADETLETTLVEGPAEATRAELLDLAASKTDAEALVLCAEPVEPVSDGWLAEMLTVASIPGVGVVGSIGISSEERIERSGVVISDGLPLVADLDEPLAFDDPDRVSASQTCVRNFSASTGTVMVRRDVLERLGGLSSHGFDQLAETDLCLRAREAGLRVAVTPLARLRRAAQRSWAAETDLAELFAFQRRWWSEGVDPYYHPHLCGQRAVFAPGPALRRSPSAGWRPPTVGDGEQAQEPVEPGVREELAAAYLRGTGIEIGALHSPLRVPDSVTVRYVDRMPVTLLRRHYPELAELPLVEVDILDDGERLETIKNATQDFVIANHLLEHTGDPIATIGTWLRVLRPGGVIYLAVPDKRFTFDSDRQTTPLEHIVRDYEQGPEVSRRQHFEEWARHVEGVPEDRVAERADALEELDYSVHTHVFTERELLELLLFCGERFGELEIEALRRNGLETVVVLRKPDPDAPRPEPAPAYDELPVPG
jgi:GT2 family glycosyltransferase